MDKNDTPAGKTNNRRVEFIKLQNTPKSPKGDFVEIHYGSKNSPKIGVFGKPPAGGLGAKGK